MSGMKHIFMKELARVFKDKKMVFSVFLLPVLIMVVIMSIMDTMVGNMIEDIEEHTPIVYVQNEPESFDAFLKAGEIELEIKEIEDKADRSKAEGEVLNGSADLIVEFPKQFEKKVADYKNNAAPQIAVYYNPSEDYSSTAYEVVSSGVLEGYRQMLLSQRVDNMETLTVFTVNTGEEMIIQDDDKASGKAFGMMLPYFITILLFAGALGVGTDMIAGEKERGTMASLLVSPVKRSSIALGKIFSLMVISGLSSLIYVAVMVIFTPLMMNNMMSANGMDLHLSVEQILMLGVLLVVIAFFYSAIIALISVFAKSTKEASSYVMPVYMLVLVVGILTMFQTGTTGASYYYIPVYNNAIALQGILTQELTMSQYMVTLGETLLLGVIFTVAIVKAFKSEKVMSK